MKTGKTSAEPVTAVMVEKDTDRFDLKIKGRTPYRGDRHDPQSPVLGRYPEQVD